MEYLRNRLANFQIEESQKNEAKDSNIENREDKIFLIFGIKEESQIEKVRPKIVKFNIKDKTL